MAFVPATNSLGLTLLTFVGYEHKTGETQRTFKCNVMNNGEVVSVNLPKLDDEGYLVFDTWNMYLLVFNAKGNNGLTSKTSIMVSDVNSITVGSKLFDVLSSMGFDFTPYIHETIDEDGDSITYFGELDEDGDYSTAALVIAIMSFLAGIENKKFRAKLVRNGKGFYQVDHKTLTAV